MEVKVKVSNIERLISEKLKKAVSASVDKSLARKLANTIKIRTQLGFGTDGSGKQSRLKPLSDSYKKQRKGEIAFFTNEYGQVIPYDPDYVQPLYSKTTPSKSNLTRTGEMLESLRGFVNDNTITVQVTGIRDDGLTNREVLEYTEEDGRPFLYMTNAEKNELIRELKNRIMKNLK